MDEIEAGGIPVVMLRGDGQINPDGIRDYDLLVPALDRGPRARATRGGARRVRARCRLAGASEFIAEHGVIPPPAPP